MHSVCHMNMMRACCAHAAGWLIKVVCVACRLLPSPRDTEEKATAGDCAMKEGACVLQLARTDGLEGVTGYNLSELFRHSHGRDLKIGRPHPSKGICPDIDLWAVPTAATTRALRASVSRQHATLSLSLRGGHPVLEITNTGAHGTFIGGANLGVGQKQKLKSGTLVSFVDTPLISEASALKVRPTKAQTLASPSL